MSEPIAIGEAIEQMLPTLQDLCDRSKAHCDKIRAEMEGVSQTCPDHEDTELEVDWDKTFGRSHLEGRLVPCFKQCQKCRDEMKGSLVNERWLKMGVPQKNAHATFKNYDVTISPAEQKKAIIKFQMQLAKNCGFIIALGKVGTGKSHLAAAALKEGGGGVFITQADMIGQLRQTYSDNTGQEELVDRLCDAKILVLDELSAEVKGTDVSPFLYRVLARRYDEGKLTVLTSNEDLDTVKLILGDRIKDRMSASYVVVNFTWASYRKHEQAN